MGKTLRIGIIGAIRGCAYFEAFNKIDTVKVTAVCENSPYSLDNMRALGLWRDDLVIFSDYDEFINSGLFDAVVLTNYYSEHAPYAIKAMERGIHVLSECTPAVTMAECVELCRTVEKTGCKYMLAENYPYFACNMDMKRRYDSGKLGRALYCEGEYVHPSCRKDKNTMSPGRNHWRNWIPASYYLTHSIAPLMYITGNDIKAVNCKAIFAPEIFKGTARRNADAASVMMLEMQDGSVMRAVGCAAWGGHGNYYRICCENGCMENVRGTLEEIRVQYNNWMIPEGEEEIAIHKAKWHDDDYLNTLPGDAGHGGGDFWVAYYFAKYILEDYEIFFDVYRSVSLSALAILALRSSIDNGCEYVIPNFRDENERAKWENDTASPFPDENGVATLPCCSHPDYRPSEEDYAQAEADWSDWRDRFNHLCKKASNEELDCAATENK